MAHQLCYLPLGALNKKFERVQKLFLTELEWKSAGDALKTERTLSTGPGKVSIINPKVGNLHQKRIVVTDYISSTLLHNNSGPQLYAEVKTLVVP